MKKALALVMAIAMVASMAAVSFAATGVTNLKGGDKSVQAAVKFNKDIETYDSTTKKWDTVNDEVVEFGKTVYVVLVTKDGKGVNDSDAVANVKVDAKWTKNGDYVKSVEIVKVGGMYAVAVATTGSDVENVQVEGELALAGKSKNKDENGKTTSTVSLKDVKTAINIELGYELVEGAAVASGMKVGAKKVYQFKDVAKDAQEDFEIMFGDDILVETNVKNMKKVILGVSTKDNEELLDAYVDADLLFYNCTAAFRRTATVSLYAEEGSYLYEVVDGELVAVDAEYDEWEEAFVFNTRKLGNYVVSDVELEVAEEVVATNPSTGAAA